MRSFVRFVFVTVLLSSALHAQNIRPELVVSGGYSGYDAGGHSSGATFGRLPRGWDTTAAVRFTPRYSIVADLGRYSDSKVGSTFTYLFGPEFTFHRGPFAPYFHALMGAQRLQPKGLPSYTAFTEAVGGGVTVNVAHRWSVRLIQADFVYAADHENGSTKLNQFYGTRVSAGIAYNFGNLWRRPKVAKQNSPEPTQAPAPPTAETASAETPAPAPPATETAKSEAPAPAPAPAPATPAPAPQPAPSELTTPAPAPAGPAQPALAPAPEAAGTAAQPVPPATAETPQSEAAASAPAKSEPVANAVPQPVPSGSATPAPTPEPAQSAPAPATAAPAAAPAAATPAPVASATPAPLATAAPVPTAQAPTAAPAPAPAATPVTQSVANLRFPYDMYPTLLSRKDKIALSALASRMKLEPDSTAVIVADSTRDTSPRTAAQRAVNAKDELVKKGIAAERIQVSTRVSTAKHDRTELIFVPRGAAFDAASTKPVDESKVKPQHLHVAHPEWHEK